MSDLLGIGITENSKTSDPPLTLSTWKRMHRELRLALSLGLSTSVIPGWTVNNRKYESEVMRSVAGESCQTAHHSRYKHIAFL